MLNASINLLEVKGKTGSFEVEVVINGKTEEVFSNIKLKSNLQEYPSVDEKSVFKKINWFIVMNN